MIEISVADRSFAELSIKEIPESRSGVRGQRVATGRQKVEQRSRHNQAFLPRLDLLNGSCCQADRVKIIVMVLLPDILLAIAFGAAAVKCCGVCGGWWWHLSRALRLVMVHTSVLFSF